MQQSAHLPTIFETSIAPWIVLIYLQSDNGESWGTGTIISATETHALIVTARHVVLGFPDSPVRWQLTRGLANGLTQSKIDFETDGNLRSPNVLFQISSAEEYDVAQMLVPIASRDNTQTLVDENEKPPPLIDPKYVLKPGVPLAWAGFPAMAFDCLREHTMCLYTGTVAATSATLPVYLIDGNVAPGVSGGPVWDTTQPDPAIVGIVSAYWHGDKKTPGLSHFVPLNPMGMFIQQRTAR